MKRIIKNITTTIVVIAVLLSTLGLQIYSHSCKTHNFFASSFIEKPECEKNHSPVVVVDDCCKIEETEETSCCDVETGFNNHGPVIKSKDFSCCETTIQQSNSVDNLFIQADKKIVYTNIDLNFTEISKVLDQQSEQKLRISFSDIPPPLFGKVLLKSIHQLKLDIPFC